MFPEMPRNAIITGMSDEQAFGNEAEAVMDGEVLDRPLTPRQNRFCELYAAHGNGTKAAKEAGYSHASAGAQASTLLTNQKIKDRVEELRVDYARAAGINAVTIRQMLLENLRLAVEKGQMGPATRCLELIGKTVPGIFAQDTAVETISDKAVLAKIKEINPDVAKALEKTLPPDSFDRIQLTDGKDRAVH